MPERLWLRIAASFLLFVGVGTVGLIILLTVAFERWSYDEFRSLASGNAEFIRVEKLPRTDRLTSYLSRMLGVEVRFGRVPSPDARHEAVTVPIDSGMDLTLIRERPTLGRLLLRPVTIATLVAFWALWFALAWAVIRPYLRAQRFALLGGMATSLAHQIRNPVAAIRLHGQLLEKSQGESARLIVNEATKIEDLVNQWMFLARPDPPRKTEVMLGELLEEVARLAAPTADHAGVRLVLNTKNGGRVHGDARRLGQVFHNLVLNAIQAMPTGGTLTITAEERNLTFADTGPGFSPTALRRWAEMLYSEKEGGMGIGLNVAKEIISAHGGRLTVTNRPEGGAMVRVEL